MSIKSIVFDLDGTLIDSAGSILGALAKVLKNQEIESQVPLDPCLIGPPLQKILLDLTGFELADERLSILIEHFKTTYDESYCLRAKPYPGINDVLHQITVGHRLMIATNKRKRPTQKILEHFSWSQYFDEVFCLDHEDPPFKCKVEILEALIQKMGIERDLILYIGDREEDLDAAKTCRVAFALACWGYPDPAGKVIQGDSFFRLSSPAEIISVL